MKMPKIHEENITASVWGCKASLGAYLEDLRSDLELMDGIDMQQYERELQVMITQVQNRIKKLTL